MTQSEFEQLEAQTNALIEAYQQLKQENESLRNKYHIAKSLLQHLHEQLQNAENHL